MKAKSVIRLCNGRAKIAKGRKGGDHKSQPKYPLTRHEVLAQIQDREVREDLLTGDYRHPAAVHVETALEPADLRNVVVFSCGISCKNDNNGSGRSPSSPQRIRTESIVSRGPRLTSEQIRALQLIDAAIRRSA